jgi:hypothetical protein
MSAIRFNGIECALLILDLSRFLAPNRPGGFAAKSKRGARSAPATSAESALGDDR